MKALAEKKAIDAALDEYRRQLDMIPDELFTQTPPKGGWSYAEVYSHILQANLGASVAMQKCMQGSSKPDGRKPNIKGKLFLWLGDLFPLKIKAPAAVAERIPARKIDKEEARNLIIKFRKRIAELVPLMPQTSTGRTIPHPALGNFNAAQWLRFIRIHTRHHLRQLKRIDKQFAA